MGKLVRLELFNFKSYKGHHVLLFGNSYFTSIIGPNGSGKSNAMDAISFVLGIKSSHLRSSHLKDLIYRGRVLKTSKINADGTAARPVNGDANSDDDSRRQSQRSDPTTAWVAAVYEDDAGDEQSWKRSITSSGQSEYRINNHVVSSKQYNDALEAENILIKARNFLVFQGDVEAIASQSPKDLTRLVEQISGSLEYKADYDLRQEEAEKANEDQSLKHNQRRGINAEIKQFSEQMKEAENYNKRVDERDQAVVTHVLWKLYHLQQTIEQSGAEIQRHHEELKEQRRGAEKFEKRLEDARREQARSTRELTRVDRSIKSTQKDIEAKRNEMLPIDEKIAITRANVEKHASRIAEVTTERDKQVKGTKRIENELDIVRKAQTKWQNEFQAIAQKQGRQLSELDMQEYHHLKAEVNKESATTQMAVDNISRQRRTEEESLTNLQSNVSELDKQRKKLEDEIVDIKRQRDNASASITASTKDAEAKRVSLNTFTSERIRAAQRQTELDEKLQSVLNKLLEADDGRRQNEKEVRMKETVFAMKRIFSGVKGRVHELCKPKQKKYDVAVSTVLGRNFDSIVVDTERTARDCIAYLRDQRLGQATFLPLDTIQVKPVNSSLKSLHKNMRLAIDTVDVQDSTVENAVQYACGNAMVCDDVATARFLCFERNVEAKAVTLDGTVIHKGGLMTGGRGPRDRNARKWEESEVDNLRKLKDKLMDDLATLPKGRYSIEQEERMQSELADFEQRIALTKDEIQALTKNLEGKQKEAKFIQKTLQESRPKLQKLTGLLESLQQKLDQSRAEVAEVEDKIYAVFCERLGYANVREYEAEQGSLQQEAAQKKLEFTVQRTKLENQLAFEKQRFESTNQRLKSLEDQNTRNENLIKSLLEEKDAMDKELEDIGKHLSTLETHLSKLKEEQENRVDTVAVERREVQKHNKEIDTCLKQVSELESDLQRSAATRYSILRKCKIEEVKLPLAQGSTTLDSLPVDVLLQSDQDPNAMDVDDASIVPGQGVAIASESGIAVDFENLDDELKEDPSAEQEKTLQQTVTSINSELSSLNPNMRAVERHNAAAERLRNSEADFNVARRAARDAQKSFENVRLKRAELFNRAFNHISEQIGPVYRALTRSTPDALGGSAYLDTMTADDETPFLAGLKYHAMPPSKRFRDMDALSGGEKTIAALALLFAIHSYAPSPFFVLDEVDAALDAANVKRVANYIKEHAKPGMQFIVISLKTGLFQESECLVGVLRDQGENTSRAITLDLRKYQPD